MSVLPRPTSRRTGAGSPADGPPATAPLPAGTGAELRRALDGPFHALKQRWRTEVDPADIVRDASMPLEEARAWTLEKLRVVAGRGLVVAGFPAAYGGTGTIAESVAHFEMLAQGDLGLAVKSGVQHGLFGGAIAQLGTVRHHEEFLPGVVSCELTGVFAMTELGHGSDVASVETTLTHLPEVDEIEVHSPTPSATKAYLGNAARDGRWAVVFGQLVVAGAPHGVHAVLVEIRDEQGHDRPGVTTGDQKAKGGLLGVDNGTIRFDHVRVPRTRLLDRHGGVDADGTYHSPIASSNARFFTMLGTLVRGRICVGAAAASATRKGLSIATRYALVRRQFRLPGLGEEILLLDYQTHQRRLLPNIAKAYAYGFALNELSAQLQRVTDLDGAEPRLARELEARAAAIKVLLTRWANDTLQVCREACGGAGYLSVNGLTGLRADADVFATFEGDNTVLSQLVARSLLLDYRQAWGEMDLRGTAQATARMLGGTFLERTAARSVIERLVSTAARRPESEVLRSRGWHVQTLEDRERHVVEGLARRMRAAARARDAFAATNACQTHMLVAAGAHADRVVLEAFIAGIEACTDPEARLVLERLADLFVLSVLDDNRGWMLEHERIDSARSRAITEEIDRLCLELRPVALDLVEGLGVEESWLNSAMLLGPATP